MNILVVGTIGFDDIQAPAGRVWGVLGGSAVYFALAASLFSPVRFSGVVGTDFPDAYRHVLGARNIDLRGLVTESGKTFRWSGYYDRDLNVAQTREVELNVLATFRPVLPNDYLDTPIVFLANNDPDVQLAVIAQLRNPKLLAMDTMNFWIQNKPEGVREVMRRVQIVILNDAELRQYAREENLRRAAEAVLALGPYAVIVKKGEHGAAVFTPEGYFATPAYPLRTVQDPTGAGDSFAGGLLGTLAGDPDSLNALKLAVVNGSALASFTCEDFGIQRLLSLTREELDGRSRELREFLSVNGPLAGLARG